MTRSPSGSAIRIALLLLACAACGPLVGDGDGAPASEPDRAASAFAIPTRDTVVTPPDPPRAIARADPPPRDTLAEPPTDSIGCWRMSPDRPGADTAYTVDLRGGVRFSCVLRAGRRPASVVLEASEDGYPRALRIAFPARNPRWTQVLDATAEERPYRGAPVLEALDYDGDGWADLRTLQTWGATGNRMHHVWLFDPRRERFERNALLSDSMGGAEPVLPRRGEPCVRDHWNGGHAGLIHGWRRACRRAGRWVAVEGETQDHLSGDRYVRVRQERRGGRMTVVRTDTLTRDQAHDP